VRDWTVSTKEDTVNASKLLGVVLSVAWPLVGQFEASAQGPRIRFEGTAVLAEGLLPGARVVWFSVAREIHRSRVHLVRREAIVEDEDQQGQVRFQLDGPVPVASVWVAVELATGAFSAATPEGMERREILLPEGALSAEVEGAAALADRREFLEALLVRPGAGPGVGAWGGTVGDGGASDAGEPTDERLLLALAALRPLEEGPSLDPAAFAPGDILVGVDTRTLQFYAARLEPGDLP
jgi:hypothetical protein